MPNPSQLANPNNRIVAASPLYQGLADFSGATSLPPGLSLSQVSAQNCAELRTAFDAQHVADDMLFRELYDVLAGGELSELVVHLGCYEKTLVLSLKPMDRFKFWRKRNLITNYL